MTVPNSVQNPPKKVPKKCQKFIWEIIKKFTQNLKISTFIENFQNQILFGKLLKNKIQNTKNRLQNPEIDSNGFLSWAPQNAENDKSVKIFVLPKIYFENH